MADYNAIKVFTASKAKEREALGEVVTAWIQRNRSDVEVIKTELLQSSDQQFHCLTIVVFYRRVN